MSALTEEDRRRAREVAAAMPPWTDEQLAELARVAEMSRPPAVPPPPRARSA